MSKIHQLPFDFTSQALSSRDDFLATDANAELLEHLFSRQPLTEQFYYLWGEHGAGKSHLLQALCSGNSRGVYVPLDKYASHEPDILQGLEQMDLVCLDDIDCIMGKQAWEESFFAFFNAIRDAGGRLVVSALVPPRKLQGNIADLGSRLSWAVVYQVHTLSEEERSKALQKRIESRGIPLTPEVISYILLRSPRSMKGLLDVVEKLDRLSLAEKRRITIPFVRQMMQW